MTIDPSTSCLSSGHIVGSTDLPPAPSTNDALPAVETAGSPRASDGRERRRGLGFGGIDPHAGLHRAHHRADAGEQSAAAERRDDGIDVRQVLEDLEAGGRVAGDEVVVVERVHEVAAHAIATSAIRPSASIRRRWP